MLASARSPRFTTLMFGALFIYFVAVLFQLPMLFFMTSALLVVPMVSYLLAAAGLRHVAAERRLPARLWPDERTRVELRVRNHAWLPKCLLRVDEELPDGLAGDPLDPPGCVVPMLWDEPFVHRYPIIARHRGRYLIPPVAVTALDTFDLFRARRQVGPGNEVVVYPRCVPVNTHELHAPNLDGTYHRSRPIASGTDFRATREYQPGDDLRRVHWRSTARRNHPIVVEFEEPTTTELFLVLDVGVDNVLGTGRDNTLETGITLAASVVSDELEHGNAVGLWIGTPSPVRFPLTRERHDLLRFLEALAVVEPAPQPFAATVAQVAELAPSTAVTVLVSSSLDQVLVGSVALLARRRAAAYVWLDPTGYPGAAERSGDGFLSELKRLGVVTFRVRREGIAAGLAQPW